MKAEILLISLMLMGSFSTVRVGTHQQLSEGTKRLAECPQINVECPDPFDEKTPLQFNALVKGTDASQNLTYSWSISKGKIKSGQGTDTITVEVGDGERQGLTATVEVGGLPKECVKSASCTTMIASLSIPMEAAPNNSFNRSAD